VAYNENRSYSIHELDAASNNSVDDIRTLNEQVRIPPQIGAYSIYIIDEVHMLSQSAFNAFLKTLEEPPAHAIFVLATTEKHKIIPTILSRCQIFDFNRIRVEDAVNYLKEIAQKESLQYEEDYYGDYVDFDIPWTMRVDYSFSYSKPKDAVRLVQTLRASGDFSLSPNWKIGFNTGYDLDRKQFTTTNLSIYRDLHCWEMRISVVPFGSYKSYNFQINAKSSILSDLKYNKRQSWQDNF